MSAYNCGALHMIPVDRDGSVTKMKLVSVHMATLSPLSEMKNLGRDHSGVKCNEQAGNCVARISRFSFFKQLIEGTGYETRQISLL